MTRDEIMETAANLINGDRQAVYGPAKKNHEDIAAGWAIIFGVPITAHQVALAMTWVKTCRAVKTPNHADSYIDGTAYFILAGELATEEDKPAENVTPFKQQA